ncbi:MAG: crotonase [Pseudomonadales bacterium]|nr:crotonase [Pseudomonadales bacterium]
MSEPVLREVRDGVGVITLNRPDVMNAWNGPLCQGLDSALAWARDNDDVGAVVITGSGRAFCAGADLSGGGDTFAEGGTARGGEDDVAARTPRVLPWEIPKPVIAAINGHAVGVGATYALACDMRIAADTAKIAFVFARRGMLPELGCHAVLPNVVGLSNASDLLLSGRPVLGPEAAILGLVSLSLPVEQVIEVAIARASEMAQLSAPVSMAITKRLLWQGMGVEEMRAREEPLFDWVATQPDAVEGVVSFLEKRQPDWQLSASKDFPNDLFD